MAICSTSPCRDADEWLSDFSTHAQQMGANLKNQKPIVVEIDTALTK